MTRNGLVRYKELSVRIPLTASAEMEVMEGIKVREVVDRDRAEENLFLFVPIIMPLMYTQHSLTGDMIWS